MSRGYSFLLRRRVFEFFFFFIEKGVGHMTCTGCRLHETCVRNRMMGTGKIGARIMVVQENPYMQDSKYGKYMEGKSGRLFKNALLSVGLDPETDCYFTAVVKCDSPDNRMPMKDEVYACYDFLQSEIEVINPEIIVPTGAESLKMLTGLTGITKHRGKLVEKGGRKYFPVIHPNLILKQPKYLEDFGKDIEILHGLLHNITPSSIPTFTKKRLYADKYEDAIKEIQRFMNLPSGSKISFDIEAIKTNPFISKVSISDKEVLNNPECTSPKIIGIGLSDASGYGCAIPIYHKDNLMSGNQIGTVVKFLRKLFSMENLEFVAHNGKFDKKWLKRQLDIEVPGFMWDTMLIHYQVITEEKGTHGLKGLAWLETDMGGYDDALDDVKPKGVDEGNYGLIPWDILKVYLADDVDCTYRLAEKYVPILQEDEQQMWIWNNLTYPGAQCLEDIEYEGAYIDRELLKKYKQSYQQEIDRLYTKLHEYPDVVVLEREWQEMWKEREYIKTIPKSQRTEEQSMKFKAYERYNPAKGGCVFNFSSIAQLSNLLFERLGLTTDVFTDKGKYSTNDDSLKYMAKQHPICDLLMEYRKVVHLNNNFILAFDQFIDDAGFVHATYNIHGTVTGRLSSSDPNAQQIPRKVNSPFLFQYNNEIKALFTSRFGDDGCIVQFDYSQLELRILAVITGDKNLIDLYKSGVDLHKATASSAFNVPLEEVTKDQRTASKKIGFGIVYQESPGGLSSDLRAEGIDLSVQDCERFIENYFKRFPQVEKWIAKTKRHAKSYKFVKSLTGRIRHLNAVDSVEKSIANEAIRQSVNAPIQSSGSDCTLLSMILINKWLKETGKRSRICITVHDSIVLDCPKVEVIEVAKKVKDIMEHLGNYNEYFKFLGDVPIVSEMEIGYNYGHSFECTVEELEEQGIDEFLQAQLQKKRDKEDKLFQESEEQGMLIPPYVTGYWERYQNQS